MKNLIVLLIVIFMVSCSQKNEVKKLDLCEATLIEDCSCLQVYEPVCGCDRKTYPNSCYAACSSVLTFVEGECP